MLSTLLGSLVAETIINKLSSPEAFFTGVHSKGPTVFSSVLFGWSVPAGSCAVVIGCRSVGQSWPAKGLQW